MCSRALTSRLSCCRCSRIAAAPTSTSVQSPPANCSVAVLLLVLMRAASPPSVLGLVPRLLLPLSKAAEPADARLLLLLVPEGPAAAVVSSRSGSGQEAVGVWLMRQMRAVSGTLLTGRISFARKALMRVDLPVCCSVCGSVRGSEDGSRGGSSSSRSRREANGGRYNRNRAAL